MLLVFIYFFNYELHLGVYYFTTYFLRHPKMDQKDETSETLATSMLIPVVLSLLHNFMDQVSVGKEVTRESVI